MSADDSPADAAVITEEELQLEAEAARLQKERDEADKVLSKSVMSAAAGLVRESSGLPRRGDDYELCNSFTAFNQFVQQQENRIHSLMNGVMSSAGSSIQLPRDLNDFDRLVKRLMKANDHIAERTSILLDELERAGRDEEVKVPQTIIGAESTRKARASHPVVRVGSLGDRLREAHENRELASKALQLRGQPKPQKQFKLNAHIDNSREKFASKLKTKHHCWTPSGRHSGITVIDENGDRVAPDLADQAVHPNPYFVELEHFEVPEQQLRSEAISKLLAINDTPLVFVDTVDGLRKLVEDLNSVSEFSVDLEHHSFRSFMGLTCLIQISTRSTDYVLDPFPIWTDMNLLNEPFSDPKILKVFHGADSDVLWLQRDFGVHVVNMFDTYHAMHRLNMAKFSLAYLVSTYCAVALQKQYQKSDWRIRPLPSEMIAYARGDTHYLLHCYDVLREKLLAQGNAMANLVRAVYEDSRRTCEKAFEKPLFDETGYEKLLGSRRSMNNRQLFALKELWRWRDEVARKEDDSVDYVLPSHMMLHIAEALPAEMQGIIACCSPVPMMVKEHLLELHDIIHSARDRPVEKQYTVEKSAAEDQKSLLDSIIDAANRMDRVKSLLRCKVDFSFSRFDEQIGRLNLIEEVEGDESVVPEKAPEDTYLTVMAADAAKHKTPANEEHIYEKKDTKKMEAVLARLENWGTPYESYRLGVKEASRKKAEKEAEEKRLRELEGPQAKTTFSHHDPPVARNPEHFRAGNVNEDDIHLSQAGNKSAPGSGGDKAGQKRGPAVGGSNKQRVHAYSDDQILTKKMLKLKRKKTREGADISTRVPDSTVVLGEEEPSEPDAGPSFKRTKREPKPETIAEADDVSADPVDYSQYDPKMFNSGSGVGDEFDPFHQKFRVERKRNNRRGRGNHRGMGNRSIGFQPKSGQKK